MDGLRIPNRIIIVVLGMLVVGGVYGAFVDFARHPEEQPTGDWLMWSIVSLQRLVEENPGTEHVADMFDTARSMYPQRPSSLEFEGLRQLDYISPAIGHVYLEEGAVLEGALPLSVSNPALWAERQAAAERKLELLRAILEEHPLPPWGDLAAMHLGYALVSLERYEEAIPFLERAMTSLKQQYSEIQVPLQLAKAYRRLGRYDDAERTLREALEVSSSAYLLHALAVVLEEKGDLKGALSVYHDVIASPDVGDYWRVRLAEKEQELHNQVHRRVDGEHGAVHGRVVLNGVGLAKTRVFLVHDINRSVWASPSIPAMDTVTNADGEFAMYGVPVGRYRLGVEVPIDLVHGTLVRFDAGVVRVTAESVVESNVAFERTPRILHAELQAGEASPILSIAWEPDPRAAAYTLLMNVASGTSSDTYGLPEHSALPTLETSIRLPLDRWFTGPFHDAPARSGSPHVAALLGVRTPEARLQLQVIPLDDSGEPLLGSQVAWRAPVAESTDHVAVVEMPEYNLSEADLLLVEGRYAEAVALYEQHLAAHPDDLQSLEVLAYLLRHGIDSRGTLQDEARADELYARIPMLLGDNE